MSAPDRYCCKSLFALVITIPPGCRRDFHVKMWGTSSPDDKLTGDLGNVIEATQICGRRSDRLMARKLSSSNFGLLQQYRHIATRSDVRDYGEYWRVSGPSAKCSGHFVRGVPRQLDLNRYGAERPRRAVASGLRTPAWRRARQSSPLASRRRTPDG